MTTADVDLDLLDDQRLVANAAERIGVPRAEIPGDRFSFVLHAPLELLARAALLPMVAPDARDAARARIAALAADYEACGPALEGVHAAFDSLESAAAALAGAVREGDLAAIDLAAGWLGERARPDQLRSLLGELCLPALAAAGHANIYLALLDRTQPRGLPGQMLRHPARSLGLGPKDGIAVPAITSGGSGDALLSKLSRLTPVGPPAVPFIAPLLQHAQAEDVFAALLEEDGTFHVPAASPFQLLRYAAQTMLQGDPAHAPYGWTHCFTLAQAPLMIGNATGDVGATTFVAAAYMAAHWAAYGQGVVDLTDEPAPVAVTASALATAASRNHDAHRVKYTLACIDAAAADPEATPLYLAAAAYLNDWWDQRGDSSDPHPELVTSR
ncbi:MAG: hypothetical protein JO054_10480 [Actinobacteria bacterium]|nr:hypothetical protein [Actinomycetota bacterium]